LVELIARAEVAPFPRLVEMVRERVASRGGVAAGVASYPFGYGVYLRTRLRRWRKHLRNR